MKSLVGCVGTFLSNIYIGKKEDGKYRNFNGIAYVCIALEVYAMISATLFIAIVGTIMFIITYGAAAVVRKYDILSRM